MRAMKSLKRYPLPITSEKEACDLEGVGSYTARRMMRGFQAASAAPPGNEREHADGDSYRRNDVENIEPSSTSLAFRNEDINASRGQDSDSTGNSNSFSGCARGSSWRTSAAAGSGCHAANTDNRSGGHTSLLRMNFCSGSGNRSDSMGGGATEMNSPPLPSLAANFAALRDTDGAQTPDVTPKRPASRARREEAGGGGGGGAVLFSKAPKYFFGQWEAWLLVDNREHQFMSMQVCASTHPAPARVLHVRGVFASGERGEPELSCQFVTALTGTCDGVCGVPWICLWNRRFMYLSLSQEHQASQL